MSYIDSYIDGCSGFGWQGGPEFLTDIVELKSGREVRNASWARVRHKFSMPFRNIDRSTYAAVKRMHMVCRGQLNGFRYRDELDYEANAEIFGEGDGVKTVFQLSKTSEIAGVEYTRDCFAIVSYEVKQGSTVVTPTVDMKRGTVTFSSPPTLGAILSWSGIFDVWVRFNQDDLPFSIDDGTASGERFINGSIDLIEIPPPEIGED